MNKSDLVKSIQKKNELYTKGDIEDSLNLILNYLSNTLSSCNRAELRGFGTFSKKINRAKMVRNPKTNNKIFKEQSFKIHFKTGKILHKKLNTQLST